MENAAESPTYIAIWAHQQSTSTESYGFAIDRDLDEEHTGWMVLDLTAEEVGQLLGGS